MDLHRDESPVTVAYKSFSPIITTLHFLQVGTSTKMQTTLRTPMGCKDFFALHRHLTALFSNTSLPVGGLTPLASPMDLTTAVASLKTLMLCSPEEAFGKKANALQDALVCMVPSNSLSHDTKDSL